MPFGSLLVAAIVVGVVLYLITLIPMDQTMAQIVRVVVIAVFVIYLIQVLVGGSSIAFR